VTAAANVHTSSSSNRQQLVSEAHTELIQTLSILDADIEDLEASVSALEGGGAGWGIERDEVVKRRRELERVKKEVDVSLEATGKAYHLRSSGPAVSADSEYARYQSVNRARRLPPLHCPPAAPPRASNVQPTREVHFRTSLSPRSVREVVQGGIGTTRLGRPGTRTMNVVERGIARIWRSGRGWNRGWASRTHGREANRRDRPDQHHLVLTSNSYINKTTSSHLCLGP
jgi:hypothetical protein